jgi:rod shape-determining protein MreD
LIFQKSKRSLWFSKMYRLRIGIYLLIILVLQTVLFTRLNLFGVSPDLVLVSIVIMAVLDKWQRALTFAAVGAFLQDVFSYGIYINVILKVLMCAVISGLKENLWGGQTSMVVLLVAACTPLVLLAEGLILIFFFGRPFLFSRLVLNIILQTAYNLVLIPVLLPVMRSLIRE